MNNILDFTQYRSKVREYNSIIVNEGIVDKIKEKVSTSHVDKVLDEEIELGKQVEERIKATMEELAKICEKLKVDGEKGNEFKKALNKIIDDINKTSFDTLSILGDTSIDFSGFKKSAVMANVVNISVLFSPIKNALMLRRAYRYFIGLIKQSIRRDLVMLIINFDQFQNMILQKSIETEDSSRVSREVLKVYGKIEGMYEQALAETVGKKGNRLIDKIKDAMEIKKKEIEMMDKHNPFAQFFANSYENTYKQTADTLKQLIGEDNQKQLESYKNGIQKIASTDKDGKLGIYGEYLISIAEEKAFKSTIEIHTNFLKIAEVFKLSNQKKLVEMMQKAEEQYQSEIAKMEKERARVEKEEFDKKFAEFIDEEGEKLLDKVGSFGEYTRLHEDVNGPNDVVISQKEILRRYLYKLYNKDGHIPYGKDFLNVIVPYCKYDKDYNKGYLSYLDIIVEKVLKMFVQDDDKNNYYLTWDEKEMDDKRGAEKIRNKFFNSSHKMKDSAHNALRCISDNVVKFDYELFKDKMEYLEEEKSAGNTLMATLRKDTYEDLKRAFEKMKIYVENDYSFPKSDDTKKSED